MGAERLPDLIVANCQPASRVVWFSERSAVTTPALASCRSGAAGQKLSGAADGQKGSSSSSGWIVREVRDELNLESMDFVNLFDTIVIINLVMAMVMEVYGWYMWDYEEDYIAIVIYAVLFTSFCYSRPCWDCLLPFTPKMAYIAMWLCPKWCIPTCLAVSLSSWVG